MESGEQVNEPKVGQQSEASNKKKLYIIIITVVVVVVVVVAVVLGVVLGTKKDEKEDDLIVNSYDNTEELIKQFPVLNPTTVKAGLEAKI